MIEQLRVRRITAYGLLAVCFGTVLLVLLDVDFLLRPLFVLVFVSVAPGWALIAYVNVRHVSVTWISAVGLSLSMCLVSAQMLVLTHWWHPDAGVVVLACGTAALLLHHVARSRPPKASAAVAAAVQTGAGAAVSRPGIEALREASVDALAVAPRKPRPPRAPGDGS